MIFEKKTNVKMDARHVGPPTCLQGYHIACDSDLKLDFCQIWFQCARSVLRLHWGVVEVGQVEVGQD